MTGQVIDLRAELVRRRRWDRLQQLRPWRVEQHDVKVSESRERPGQLRIERRFE